MCNGDPLCLTLLLAERLIFATYPDSGIFYRLQPNCVVMNQKEVWPPVAGDTERAKIAPPSDAIFITRPATRLWRNTSS